MSALTTSHHRRTAGSPHPPGLFLWLVVPTVLWLAFIWLPLVDLDAPAVRRLCRNLGYLALAAMLVPYLYVWRRLALHQYRGNMTRWIRWHIGASYLATGLTLLHGGGHLFHATLTTWIVVSLGVVMLSGVLGFFGQRFIYRLLNLFMREELGREALPRERQRLLNDARDLMENYSLLTEYDVRDWGRFCLLLNDENSKAHKKIWNKREFTQETRLAVLESMRSSAGEPSNKRLVMETLNDLLRRPDLCNKQDFPGVSDKDEVFALLQRKPQELTAREIERRNRLFLETACGDILVRSQSPPETVERFFKDEVERFLSAPFPSWLWLFTPAALEPVPRNHYLRVRTLANKEQKTKIDQLWTWVERRKQMNLEYWFHRLARAWLWFHGPAAWILFVLMLAHAATSIWYGGWI